MYPRFRQFRRPVCILVVVTRILATYGDTGPATGRPGEEAFYVDYRVMVPASKAGAFPVAILHPDVKTDLARLRRNGTRTLAYVSIGEMASDAGYRDAAKGLPLLGTNKAWNSAIIDLRDSRWRDLLLKEIAAPATARGFDGFFLDTPDTLLAHAGAGTPEGDALRNAIVDFVKALRAAHPKADIVLNRGFEILPRLKDVADGVMAESVFSGFDPVSGKYAPVPPADTRELLKILHGLKDSGFAVYVLDYVAPADEKAAFATAAKIRAEGFSAFVSTPKLTGECLAPWRDMPRRVLAFYKTDREVNWPEDGIASKLVQLPLEWLGYETDFALCGDRLVLPPEDRDAYAAIVIPSDFEVPAADCKAFADYLIAQKKRGVKIILFSGGDMIPDAVERKRLFDALGTGGHATFDTPACDYTAASARKDFAGFEAPLPEKGRAILPTITAPAGADVLVTCETVADDGKKGVVTPVFSCDWGGMAMAPFVISLRPDYEYFWRIDPFVFLAACLGGRRVPAADVTTADGLRVFLSHIDGDGFANRTSARPDTFTGELVRDRILKKYPLPVTVSVIEAEVRGIAKGLDEANTPRLEAAARSIFALPNVEVASHAYTHPFYWIKNDKTADSYETKNLQLKFPYEMNPDREIGGTIRYIDERLAPKDKPVKLLLWTGNCRPGPEALRLAREAGVDSMNGGKTTITKLTPTITAVAARSVPWDDELQVRAPMQNENVYTHLFTSAVRGSFIRLLQTFEMTENPRRLKAANLYYHFYSADRTDSLKAIEGICDRVMRMPLHPTTASAYVRTVRDAAGTVMFRDAAGRTLVSGNGECRTLRIPAADVYPDFNDSSGVIGFADKGSERYVALAAEPRRILALTPKAPEHAYIETSEADTLSPEIGERRVAFVAHCWKPSPVTIAGLPPETSGKLTLNGKTAAIRSDASGRAGFTLGDGDRVEIDFRP